MSFRDAAPHRRGLVRMLALVATALAPQALAAQTDYFNTDRGRPLQVQDATAIERYALELQAAPVRWSRAAGPHVVFAVEPELAYGIFPRTQVEVGLPVFMTDGFTAGPRNGVGAAHFAVLHALNVETLGLPALALEADVAVPVGDFGPQDLYASVGAIATRTTTLGRLHLNARWTRGPDVDVQDARYEGSAATGIEETSRWMAGVALDRALPLRSMLVGAEVVARQPGAAGTDVHWSSAVGVRVQLAPQWAMDAGVGRSFGDDREWSFTVGAAWSFGLVNLIPLSR